MFCKTLLAVCNEDDSHISLASTLLERGAFVNYKDSQGQTPLHACYTSKNKKLLSLIARHADINMRNAERDTVLHIVLCNGYCRPDYEEQSIKSKSAILFGSTPSRSMADGKYQRWKHA